MGLTNPHAIADRQLPCHPVGICSALTGASVHTASLGLGGVGQFVPDELPDVVQYVHTQPSFGPACRMGHIQYFHTQAVVSPVFCVIGFYLLRDTKYELWE